MMKDSRTSEDTSYFGFEKIYSTEKLKKVADVFSSVAPKYDLMNDLMSFGIHRFWKIFSVQNCNIDHDSKVLDVASGTGDLAKLIAKELSTRGSLHLLDLQKDMLSIGRDNMINSGWINNIYYSVADAKRLPYSDDIFDYVTIGFGLRNVTNIDKVLLEFYRVLKPGGKLMVLEFGEVEHLIKDFYNWYSFNVIPVLGDIVANDKKSYQYLVESIKTYPNQEQIMTSIINTGFSVCMYDDMTFGIVSMHLAYK